MPLFGYFLTPFWVLSFSYLFLKGFLELSSWFLFRDHEISDEKLILGEINYLKEHFSYLK